MNIYFSGLGGVGVGPLAEIAHDAGHTVQGSDASESLLTQELQSRGMPVSIGQDGSFLQSCHEEQPIDWFVYTAALPSDHPELVLARQLGLKITKRDDLLAHIIKEKGLKLLAVTGTHGKTTTAGMMVWVLKQLNIPISYSVGTTLTFGPSGHYDPASQYFVYECDEFDRNFLQFSPQLSLITSVDYDHPDTYPTKDEYYAAFNQFIGQSEFTIMWQRDADVLSSAPSDSWILQADEVDDDLALHGAHNRRNGTLVKKALEKIGHSYNGQVDEALSRFPGTKRRFERLADNIYTDYGHHPAEIAATLQLAREVSDQVVLVYQPHQNVRQHEIKYQYTDCFQDAEAIYWLPTHLSREDPDLPILTVEELTTNVINPASVHPAELDDELWQNLKQAQAEGKLILAMGAGSIDGWLRNQLTV